MRKNVLTFGDQKCFLCEGKGQRQGTCMVGKNWDSPYSGGRLNWVLYAIVDTDPQPFI